MRAEAVLDRNKRNDGHDDGGYPMIDMGGGQSHDNMPPYLVLNFCKKK